MSPRRGSAASGLLGATLLLCSCTSTELHCRASQAPAGFTGELWCFRSNVPGLHQVVFSPDGKCVVAAGDYSVRLLDVESGQPVSCFDGNGEDKWHARFLGGPAYFLMGTCPWVLAPCLLFYDETRQPVYAASFTPDASHVWALNNQGFVRLWDIHSGRQDRGPIKTTFIEDAAGAAVSPDGNLATTLYYGQLKVWDLERGELRWETTECRAAAFTSDGRFLATTARSGRVTVRRALTGEVVVERVFDGLNHRALASADGHRVLVLQAPVLAIFDMFTGEELQRWGPSEPWFIDSANIVWMPDERHVLVRILPWQEDSASAALVLVELSSGRECCRMPCAPKLKGLAVSLDGRLAVSYEDDGTVRLWKMPATSLAG